MSFGNYGTNNNGNNNNNKTFEPNYYAKTYFTNYEDKKSLNISYGSGLMKLTISERLDDGKNNDIISVSLTGLKSSILVSAMNQMEQDIIDGTAEGRSYGVQSGMGDTVKVIAFTVVNDSKSVIMAKVDKEGNVSEKTTFTFPVGTDFFMNWKNFDTMDFSKSFEDNMQFQMLKNILIDFSRNISGAAGYGTLYLNRYEQSRDRRNVSAIMDKLGIPTPRNNTNNYSRDSFFNNSGNSNSEHKSYSDIDEMLGSDDE